MVVSCNCHVAQAPAGIDAKVEWHEGGEESLIEQLDLGKLDVVVGGLTEKSPWASHAALTRPYVVVTSPAGSPESHVMAARMDENALLVALEGYLYEHAMYFALGSSQAMKAAWIEDLLSFLPPIAFLVSNRIRAREPDCDHPFGFHRSVSVGYLVAASALLIMGTYLVVESSLGLVLAEHTPIGLVTIFGYTFWAGWLMVAALSYTLVPPVLLGRAKLGPARELHDKVLYADADMNKADWQTAAAGIVGVIGIGVGLWWLDGAAAILIGASITRDGWKNLRTALSDLMDSRASVFVVPTAAGALTLEDLDRVRDAVRDVDWKVHDVVVSPVRELPVGNLPPR